MLQRLYLQLIVLQQLMIISAPRDGPLRQSPQALYESLVFLYNIPKPKKKVFYLIKLIYFTVQEQIRNWEIIQAQIILKLNYLKVFNQV